VTARRPLASAFYVGRVAHRRSAVADVAHAFDYAFELLLLDLDEVDAVFGGALLRSAARPAPIRFRRSDFLGDPATPLKDAARNRVAEALGRRPEGPVRLLAQPRRFGVAFNPVAFYYCYAADGTTLDAVIAEITNTPWNERHAYVLDARRRGAAGEVEGRFPKAFHVSPFLPMDVVYAWCLSEPRESVEARMTLHRGGVEIFEATMALKRRPLGDAAFARSLARFPFQPLTTLGAIYVQAARLRLKGATFHPHPRTQIDAPGGGRP
jgi:uncharacterized protein